MKKLGEKLKKKREEKHLSLEEVSAQTQITLGCLNAIENGDSSHFHDDFSYLPYYLRQYGKLLGIPDREMESEIKRLKGDIASVSEKELFEKSDKTNGEKETKKKFDFRHFTLICTILILAALILYVLIRYVFPSFRIIDPPEDAVVPEVTPHEEYVISTAVPEIVKAGKKDYNIYGWEADKAIEIRMDVFSDETYIGHAIQNDEEINDPENRIYSANESAKFYYVVQNEDVLVLHLSKMGENRIYLNGAELPIDEESRSDDGGVHLTLHFLTKE